MEKITQKESVYLAIMKNGDPETKKFTPHLVIREVMNDFKSGRTEFKVTERNIKRMGDDTDLMKYIESLVKNWVAKDKRLVEYSPSDTEWVAKVKFKAPKLTKKPVKVTKVFKRPRVDLVEDVPL